MKILTILLLTGLVFGDKLDRTYLPPPGAHLSGGVYNDTTLRLPKKNFLQHSPSNSKDIEDDSINNAVFEPIEMRDDEIFKTTRTMPESTFMQNYDISSTTSTPFNDYAQTSTESAFLQHSTYLPSENFMSTNVPNYNENSFSKGPYSINDFQNPTGPIINMPGMSKDISQDMNEKEAMMSELGIAESLQKHDRVNDPSSTNPYQPNVLIEDNPKTVFSQPMPTSNLPMTSFKTSQKSKSPNSFPERAQNKYDRNAVIVNYENEYIPGGFAFSFDTSNGIHVDESGTANNGVRAKGSYSYTGDDGKIYKVEYTADENGFQPRGDHLPTAPPIPEAIQRVIEQAYKNKAAGVYDDGSYDEQKYGYKNYMPRHKYKEPNTKLQTDEMKNNNRKTYNTTPDYDKQDTYALDNTKDIAKPILTTKQVYNNYETKTPSFIYDTDHNLNSFPGTISTEEISITEPPKDNNPTKLFTSKSLDSAEYDKERKEPIYVTDYEDNINSSPMNFVTTPTDFISTTGAPNIILPTSYKMKNKAMGEDFSGSRSYQTGFDPNTGYYYK